MNAQDSSSLSFLGMTAAEASNIIIIVEFLNLKPNTQNLRPEVPGIIGLNFDLPKFPGIPHF